MKEYLKGVLIMTKMELIKAAGELVVSVGVSMIVGNVIKATTPSNINIIKKVCIGAGGLVLGNIASDAATEYVEKRFDAAARALEKKIESC